MSINRISGNILQDNLLRGANLAIQTDLIFFDVINSRIGVKTGSPQYELDVNGNVRANNYYGNRLSVSGNVTGGNLTTAGIVTASGNITGGNLITSGLATVTGNVTAGNLISLGTVSAPSILITGNANVGNLGTTGLISATGNITGGNINTSGQVSSTTLNTSGNANVGNLGTSGLITATGNITGGNISTGGVVTATGNINTAAGFLATGNITGGNINTSGLVTATGNVNSSAGIFATGNITGGNISTTGLVTATGNIDGGNLRTTGQVTATGNVTGGNLLTSGLASVGGTITVTGNANVGNLGTSGLVTATGNITGGNVNTSGLVTATGNITGGNINTAGNVTAVGNVTGGNVLSQALVQGITVSATGNVVSGNVNTSGLITATGNITGGNVNTSGLVTATGNITGGNVNTSGLVTATGNITGGNVNTAGLITATGNITGGNLRTAGQITATGNVTGGNILVGNIVIPSVGNIDVGNVKITNLANPILSQDAATKFYVDTEVGNIYFTITDGSNSQTFNNHDTLTFSNVANQTTVVVSSPDTVTFGLSSTIAVANIISRTANGNISFTPDGSGEVKIYATNGFLVPVGNTDQRPAAPDTGTIRFNNLTSKLEVYNGFIWENAGGTANVYTITNQTISPDGVSNAYVLNQDATSSSILLTINGVNQTPDADYSVTGNSLSLSDVPLTSDIIQVRFLAGLQTTDSLTNSSGNAVVKVLANGSIQLNPSTGSDVLSYGDLLPSANITYNLGSTAKRWNNLWLSGSTITLGNIVIKNSSGNTISFYGPDGTTPATIDANAQIVADSISNGTTSVTIPNVNGNITLTVSGSTVANVATTGIYVTGLISATGNITGGNILGGANVNATTHTGTTVSVTGNITGGNILGGANVNATTHTGTTVSVTGNVDSGNLRTTGLISATGNITGGNIIASGAITATGAVVNGDLTVTGNATLSGNIVGDRITNGTTSFEIQTTNGNANISVAGVSNVAVFTSGGLNMSGLISATGNITGGNILGGANVNATTHTGTTVSVTGNVDGGNLRTTGLISATGQITGSQFNGSGAGLTSIPGSNVTGTVANATYAVSSGTATSSTTAGTVTTAAQANITSVGTLTSLSVSGNITGGNLNTVGILNSATLNTSGNANVGNLGTTGLISAAGNIVGSNLNVGIGTVSVGSIVNNNANGVGNIGSSTQYFNTVFAQSTSALYADLAENFLSDCEYDPGTVLKIGGEKQVTACDTYADSAAAGVVTTKPAYLMNSAAAGNVAGVALAGQVPCKVQGPVKKGDLLTTSTTHGHACRLDLQDYRPGCIIGKALEDCDPGSQKTITVMIVR